jgi:hypothetical protein
MARRARAAALGKAAEPCRGAHVLHNNLATRARLARFTLLLMAKPAQSDGETAIKTDTAIWLANSWVVTRAV